MSEVLERKVGIVACSGEELVEGTVARLAALKVLNELRPRETVTICLPLFLAGGEGDRAFARFYPTIAVDGCELRCAARATEMFSGKPAASLVVRELVAEHGLGQPQGLRRLNEAGFAAVEVTAGRIAETVDTLLGQKWNRRIGQSDSLSIDAEQTGSSSTSLNLADSLLSSPVSIEATCSCGSGIPVRKLFIDGKQVTLVALPLIFDDFHQQGKCFGDDTARELLETVRIYNTIPAGAEETYAETLLREFAAYCNEQERVG